MILTIAFVLLAAIILWFVIGSKGQWHLKALCIALTLYFSLCLSQSLHDVAGWPSSDELPDKFEIHWGLIQEPDKVTGEEGRIYLWLTPKEEEEDSGWILSFYDAITDTPRVYSIPYSRENHGKVEGAVEGIKQGQRMQGGKGDGEGDGEGENGEKGGDGQEGKGSGGGSISRSPELYFGPLPPPKLPEK
jgi:hypothetical protein|tara:strand:- start:11589 stop:12158 length:570 start_codon:yes stop_codon:yes gene_type:complete